MNGSERGSPASSAPTEVTCRDPAGELDALFRLSQDMLCITGRDGVVRRVNPAFVQTLGHSKATLLAAPLISFIHPDDQAATLAELASLAAGSPSSLLSFENRVRRLDGGYAAINWTSSLDPSSDLIYSARAAAGGPAR